jgi:hypothetical protein
MNIIGNNIIEYIFKFIPEDVKEYRILCKNINNIITPIYFEKAIVNVNNILRNDAFIKFVNKYKLCINAKNVPSIKQLLSYKKRCKHSKLFKSITFDARFNKEINIDELPASLTSLKFGFRFNQKINIFPPHLTSLEFGRSFNHEIDIFPSTLTHLVFNGIFNQRFKPNVLPPNLKVLKLYGWYNTEIEQNVLPYGLIHLEIKEDYTNGFDPQFNQEIHKNILPPTIEYLDLSSYVFNKDLNETNLPKNLKKLILSQKYSGNLILEGFKEIPNDEYLNIYQKIEPLTS